MADFLCAMKDAIFRLSPGQHRGSPLTFFFFDPRKHPNAFLPCATKGSSRTLWPLPLGCLAPSKAFARPKLFVLT